MKRLNLRSEWARTITLILLMIIGITFVLWVQHDARSGLTSQFH